MANTGIASTLKVTLPAGGSLVQVLDMDSIDPPSPTREFFEYFPLDGDPIVATKKPGKLTLGQVTFSGRVDYDVPGSETPWQLLMVERDRAPSDPLNIPLPCEVTINTTFVTDPKFTFSAYVVSVDLDPVTDELQTGTVTLELTTKPVLAPPAAV